MKNSFYVRKLEKINKDDTTIKNKIKNGRISLRPKIEINLPVCSNPECNALQIKLIRFEHETCIQCGSKNKLVRLKED